MKIRIHVLNLHIPEGSGVGNSHLRRSPFTGEAREGKANAARPTIAMIAEKAKMTTSSGGEQVLFCFDFGVSVAIVVEVWVPAYTCEDEEEQGDQSS